MLRRNTSNKKIEGFRDEDVFGGMSVASEGPGNDIGGNLRYLATLMRVNARTSTASSLKNPSSLWGEGPPAVAP